MHAHNHAPSLAALALLGCLAACHSDPPPPPGTLVMRQVGSRLGDTADDLGVLVVGQSVCGTHLALRSEAGTLSVHGDARRTDACLRLPLHGESQRVELLVYPAETAALLHGELLIEPGTCAALPPTCQALCPPAAGTSDDGDAGESGESGESGDADAPPFVSAACPPRALLVDQATLLVQAVLPEQSDTGSTSATGTGTGTATGTDTSTGTSTATSTDTSTSTGGSDTGNTGTGTGTSTNP